MHGMVAEGVLTSRSAHFLATKLGIDCAVLEGIYKVCTLGGQQLRGAGDAASCDAAAGVFLAAAPFSLGSRSGLAPASALLVCDSSLAFLFPFVISSFRLFLRRSSTRELTPSRPSPCP